MIKKTPYYYLRTAYMRVVAYSYDYLEKWGLLQNYLARKKTFFSALQPTQITLNLQFDGIYYAQYYLKNKEEFGVQYAFNEKGIAMGHRNALPNLLTTMYYAITCFNEKKESSLPDFWLQVQHIEEKSVQRGNYTVVEYTPFPLMGLHQNFIAGITQATACSVFLRAFLLSKDEKYIQQAERYLDICFIDVEEGGLERLLDKQYRWVEEYPAPVPTFVLNGFIKVIIALYEYQIMVTSERKQAIYKAHLEALETTFFQNLHQFQRGKYWRYGLSRPIFHNIIYDGLLTYQMWHLYQLSNQEGYKTLANLFLRNTDWKLLNEYYQVKNCRPTFFASE